MCGIFGFTFYHKDPLGLLKKMGQLQIHRGPDGEGYYVDDTVSIGMRRLSIIDLEHGNQPFFNDQKSVVVICNGEIYNYIELREELSQKGYKFKTHSDIEVLPHLYDEYGMEFVHKLNGMYAIALYDTTKREVFLIRDRLGIKPLYYAIVDNNLIFASELKSIMATNRIARTIDFDALSTYLELQYLPVPLTGFQGIFKLSSGTYLKWSSERYDIAPYWKRLLPDNTIDDEITAEKEIEKLLMDSLRMQMRSDVPVGSFLSGGVDSSAVTAFAATQTEKPFSTFHLHWKNIKGKRDESEQAAAVSRRYGTKHYVKDATDEDLIMELPRLVWHLEEPFADGAFVFTNAIAKEAVKHAKVILCGVGGDELFSGYPHHRKYSILKSILSKIIYDRVPSHSYYDRWKSLDARGWSNFFDWFKPSVCRARLDEVYKMNRSKDVVNAALLSDIEWYLRDNILFLTDKMTMAESLECRVPLLDHRLVETSLRIGSRLKIHNGEKKYIFKKLMEKYLPDEVLYRPKEGFGAPIELWINTYKKRIFNKVLLDGYLMQEKLINASKLMSLMNKEKLNAGKAWQYWKILILEIWLQLFIEERNHTSIF